MSTHPAVKNGAYDVARVRQDFPALAMQVYGKPLVYLDNAASAQKPQSVLDRMTQAYVSEYANVHRGLHYLANAATEAYEGARAKVAQFVNASRTEEIIFTRNVTEAINLVASSWGEPNIKQGDEIVLSIMEHHSNIVPWHFLRERHGAVIKWAPVDDEGNFLIDEFEKLLTPKTKLVAITQMSNALGTFVPIKEVVRLAHDRGIPVLVDGAQGAVHLPIDVQDLDCDFYAFTGHKGLWPDRHRRALCQARAPRRDAALQRRRRDDPRGREGLGHLWRPAAQVRGRHSADRRGRRPRRGHRLRQFDRQGAHRRA
ncbi:selenocysteine lyase/cysteine desulfurase [Bradyrhizobium sp. LM2.7]